MGYLCHRKKHLFGVEEIFVQSEEREGCRQHRG